MYGHVMQKKTWKAAELQLFLSTACTHAPSQTGNIKPLHVKSPHSQAAWKGAALEETASHLTSVNEQQGIVPMRHHGGRGISLVLHVLKEGNVELPHVCGRPTLLARTLGHTM